jgi:hopene-associated glycosyltransferase HpnB
MNLIAFGLMLLSLAIWLGLLSFWGQFWQAEPKLEEKDYPLRDYPRICAVIPARNEAQLLPTTMRSLLLQDYPGEFNVFLVDDHSTDGTASYALGIAYALDKAPQLQIVAAESLPSGWTGKLWALEQGIHKASRLLPDYIFLTDADIEHDPSNLRRLVAKAVQEDLDLVSVMVKLRCDSFWEQLLIPAFVFFFQKLYPFRWVNDPKRKIAAAAGGCILIRTDALERIGGISAIHQALIDDCTLGKAVKSSQGRIWLGLSNLSRSLRPYNSLKTVWDMVARSAYTQLNYSPFLLLASVAGMILVYVFPPVGMVFGVLMGNWGAALLGLLGWSLMSFAYWPMIQFYQCAPAFALSLPAIAFLYTLMTIDSAWHHWRGRGGAWKGRVYN